MGQRSALGMGMFAGSARKRPRKVDNMLAELDGQAGKEYYVKQSLSATHLINH